MKNIENNKIQPEKVLRYTQTHIGIYMKVEMGEMLYHLQQRAALLSLIFNQPVFYEIGKYGYKMTEEEAKKEISPKTIERNIERLKENEESFEDLIKELERIKQELFSDTSK